MLGLRPDFGRPGSAQETDSLVDLTAVDCTFSAQGGEDDARTGQRSTITVGEVSGPGGPAEYTAKIAWGDGSAKTTGAVRRSGGALVVTGRHRYTRRGDYPVQVTVKQLYTGTKHTAPARVHVRP